MLLLPLEKIAERGYIRLCHLQRFKFAQFAVISERGDNLTEPIERVVERIHAASFPGVGSETSSSHHLQGGHRRRAFPRGRFRLDLILPGRGLFLGIRDIPVVGIIGMRVVQEVMMLRMLSVGVETIGRGGRAEETVGSRAGIVVEERGRCHREEAAEWTRDNQSTDKLSAASVQIQPTKSHP